MLSRTFLSHIDEISIHSSVRGGIGGIKTIVNSWGLFIWIDTQKIDDPGSGRSGKAYGVKVQLEYNLLSGQFLHVEEGLSKQNDVDYGKKFNVLLI
ncbi:hypothetical protein BK788_14755 [Bacillus thuringiensis serovar sinensis]|nr:hypothetical protein [Bacillus wiedmannii]OUB84395.1 hypothetical protein BK788_14755 [Bacillus thuringiensis serovar sinensis]